MIIVAVHCDQTGCRSSLQRAGVSREWLAPELSRLLAQARRDGWRMDEGGWAWCPLHRAERGVGGDRHMGGQS